ncbi:MAG: thiamine pyrophosphate-binding protein [Terriglobales bacterium]
MRVADYIAQRIADWGTRHVFLVTGGGAMHLNDAFLGETRIQKVCQHHEQAVAMAAECYARVTGQPGVINVTTGPGGINALNGVFGAWTDSIPMLVLSGQVKRETCMATAGARCLRQLGDQEADIIRIVQGLTKYAVLVDDPQKVRYHLERAYYLSRIGRPGPCWLDIPIDVQSAQVNEDTLPAYDPAEDAPQWDEAAITSQAHDIVARIQRAKRPVVLAGTGVRLSNALEEFERVIRRLRIPVTTAWTHDLIASDDELFCGRPGTIGDRPGNFTVQNADLLLVLGSRLNVRQVSYNWKAFAPRAFKIQVDVDAAELDKPLVKPDLAVHSDLKLFLQLLDRELDGYSPAHDAWLAWCRERRERYPVVQPRQRVPGPPLNPYHFVECLSDMLSEDDIVVCGNATATIVPYQVLHIRKEQRLISNSGSASMGYDLPASIGAAFASGRRVICLAGDGSLHMNVQELQTIAHHRLPVKVMVLNNGGYLSIRTTQKNFFGRLVGESPASGISFPDFVKLGCAYGIPSVRVDRVAQLDRVRQALDANGPALCDIVLDPAQEFEPRCKSKQLPDGRIVSPPLEDMYPFLEPEELAANMIVAD